MKKGLNKTTHIYGSLIFPTSTVDILDIELKKTVFTGTIKQAAKFVNCSIGAIRGSIKNKGVCKKKYTIKHSSTKNNEKGTV